MGTKGEIKRQNSISVSGNVVSSVHSSSSSRKNSNKTKPIKKAVNVVQRELNKTEDSGLQSVAQGITVTKAGVKTFKTAQKITPTVIKTAKGVYNVGGKTIKVVKQVDSTITMIQAGAIVLNKDMAARLMNYTKNRIISSTPAIKLANAVHNVQMAAKNVRKYTIQTAYNIQRTAILARGIVLGAVSFQLSKETRERIRNAAIKGVKVGFKAGVRGVGFTAKGVFKSTVHVGKGFNKGLYSAGGTLMNTEDYGAQAAGLALKGIHYTVKGAANTPRVAKTAYKGIKGTVKGTVHAGIAVVKGGAKTYKGVKTGIKIYRKVGVSKATKMYAKRWGKSLAGKARQGIAKAGRSVATAVIDLMKLLGKKMIIPLLIILVVIFFGSSILAGVAGVVGAIFSPFISDDSGNEIDETQLITQEITAKRTDLINEIKDTYFDNNVANGGSYHLVRFYNAFNDTEIQFTESNIATSIYTVKDYVEAIQPIFHTIIVCEYEGEASKREMKRLVTEMWNLLNIIKTEEMPTEYCSMSVAPDGTVTPILDTDGLVHANALTCVNHSNNILYHQNTDNGVLSSCDSWYYICNGHKGNCTHHCNDDCEYEYICGGINLGHLFHNESCKRYFCGHSHSEWTSAGSTGCYSTNYCNGGNQMTSSCSNSSRLKNCMGYYECLGHKILALSISINSFGDLLNKYFLNEINSLEAKSTRNDDEEKRLNDLYDYYDVCLNYLTVLEEEYGYGTGSEIVDLEGVTLTSLTDFACSFIGNPYIWGGNDPNTGADCSGFVKYVFGNFGFSMNRTAHEQVQQGVMVDGIANAQPGDLIFWSENGTDSGVYHVAIYLGNNKIVHASNSRPYPSGGIKVSKVYGTIYKIKRVL